MVVLPAGWRHAMALIGLTSGSLLTRAGAAAVMARRSASTTTLCNIDWTAFLTLHYCSDKRQRYGDSAERIGAGSGCHVCRTRVNEVRVERSAKVVMSRERKKPSARGNTGGQAPSSHAWTERAPLMSSSEAGSGVETKGVGPQALTIAKGHDVAVYSLTFVAPPSIVGLAAQAHRPSSRVAMLVGVPDGLARTASKITLERVS